jgi:O-antigen/teichoic acid export membrane protein
VQGPEPSLALQPTGFRGILARLRTSQGVRGGVILAAATLVLNGAAYLYNVACIRYLGSAVYGDVAAMLALGALIALPLSSIQVVLAREVAQAPSAAGELLRRLTLRLSIAGAALVALGLALVGPIQHGLNIESRSTVVAGISAIFFAVVATGLYGVLQGSLRFNALGATYGVSGLARPLLVVPALLLGFGAAGALAVNTLAGAVAVVIAAVALRDLWKGASAPAAPFDRLEVTVMIVGSLAFASLTNVDVLLAAYFLPDEAAGVYAAAALVGKAVLFLPAAVVTVLLPKAAVRTAAGLSPDKILFASAAVTLFVTLTATVLLALVPESLLVRAFGGDFRESTALLGWFGLAMTAAALVNVYLSVYFAERDARFPLLVLAAALAQIVGISLFHDDAESLVIVTLVCATTVLVLHELFFPHALARAWRTRHRRAGDVITAR